MSLMINCHQVYNQINSIQFNSTQAIYQIITINTLVLLSILVLSTTNIYNSSNNSSNSILVYRIDNN